MQPCCVRVSTRRTSCTTPDRGSAWWIACAATWSGRWRVVRRGDAWRARSESMTAAPIKIAILAMGGEGGGVLADWIVDLAEHNGFVAQTTSVPGVAQRTGATIYYVELFR